jgi:hypothetical protein
VERGFRGEVNAADLCIQFSIRMKWRGGWGVGLTYEVPAIQA